MHGASNNIPSHSVHYNDVIMGAMASQISSLMVVYSIVYSDADQRKHQSSASLAFVRGIHRGPVNSPHKWPVTRKMLPLDDVIMGWRDIFWVVQIILISMSSRLTKLGQVVCGLLIPFLIVFIGLITLLFDEFDEQNSTLGTGRETALKPKTLVPISQNWLM